MDMNRMKETLLLHSCCGPCSTAVIERLAEEGYQLTVLFANANITEEEEYRKRLSEQKRFLSEYNKNQTPDQQVAFLEGSYQPDQYLRRFEGLEAEPEGGARCEVCFSLRLAETAETCKKLGLSSFATTLSVSPHKNVQKINRIGMELASQIGVEFLPFDFKKKNGYQRSLELSREHALYRQNYCGCEFSRRGD